MSPRRGLVAIAGAICVLALGGACSPKLTSKPEYVGRTACVSCHQPEDSLWRGSHHAVAMAVADSTTVLGNFNDATYTYNGLTSRFFRAGRAVLGQHRGAGRGPRRLSGQLHLRRVSAAAIPDRVPAGPLPGTRHRVGHPHQVGGGPTLVPPLSGREGGPPGRAALDRHVAELELHVRAVPLDQPAEGVCRGRGQLRDDLVRN